MFAIHAMRCSAMQEIASEVNELRESIPGVRGPPVVKNLKTKTSQAIKAPPPTPPFKKSTPQNFMGDRAGDGDA